MQWSLDFSRVNQAQSSVSPHFSMQPSRVAMAKESTKSPLHLKAPWHSLGGHLLKRTTTVILLLVFRVIGKWLIKYLHLLSTDAVRAGLNSRWVDAIICAIDEEHAQLKGWLPWPPIALISLAAKLVTPFCIFSRFEVNGIFLWEYRVLVAKKQVGPKLEKVLNIHGTNLALAIDIALIGLWDVHHLLILSFSVLYKYRLAESIPITMSSNLSRDKIQGKQKGKNSDIGLHD